MKVFCDKTSTQMCYSPHRRFLFWSTGSQSHGQRQKWGVCMKYSPRSRDRNVFEGTRCHRISHLLRSANCYVLVNKTLQKKHIARLKVKQGYKRLPHISFNRFISSRLAICPSRPVLTFQFPSLLLWASPRALLSLTTFSLSNMTISQSSTSTRSGMFIHYFIQRLSIKNGWSVPMTFLPMYTL